MYWFLLEVQLFVKDEFDDVIVLSFLLARLEKWIF